MLAHLDGDKPELACAILDVRLRDGEWFPAAERLREAGVPLIFHSGHAGRTGAAVALSGCGGVRQALLAVAASPYPVDGGVGADGG